VRVTLESSAWITRLWGWLEGLGAGKLKTVLAPLIVIFAVTPVIVLVALLIVAALMTPALVALVAERRFPHLERKRGGSLLFSLLWSAGSTLLAVWPWCVAAAVAGAAADPGAAAADLGLADLPGDEL
jgi:hypothetical protein